MLNTLVTKVALDLLAMSQKDQWYRYCMWLVVMALVPLALVGFLVGNAFLTAAVGAVGYALWACWMVQVRARVRHLNALSDV
ncbi:hypothetical protein [Pseudarthrobacter sp. S6]|uniref:hypothetical protein n=1 Tax=Pseudarthrobacter sp. S6 TaxID=3418420 RepID=UPI003CF60A33